LDTSNFLSWLLVHELLLLPENEMKRTAQDRQELYIFLELHNLQVQREKTEPRKKRKRQPKVTSNLRDGQKETFSGF
jgi:hypothetical protein